MSHPIIKTACVVAGFAVAALAATSAYAAKPLSVKQKNEMAEAMARKNESSTKAAPKTLTRANATLQTAAGGGTIAAVPESLDHYLSASPDANGHMRVRDTDASGPSTATAVEVSNDI